MNLPGYGLGYWHIFLYFFFYAQGYEKSPSGWRRFRSDCRDRSMQVEPPFH